MTNEQIEELSEVLDTYFMDLNDKDNQLLLLGKTDSLLQRDLVLLSWFNSILKEFELTDNNIPYKGNRNRLESNEYSVIQSAVSKITGQSINYDFKV